MITTILSILLFVAGGPVLGGATSAEFAIIGPPMTNVVYGDTVEVSVVVTNNERIAACGYRLSVTGTAGGTLVARDVTAELRFLGTNAQTPLADGLPIALATGVKLDEVFLNLDTADPPGNPLDGFAPATQGEIATYTLVVTGSGELTLTLEAPHAAETQSDTGGALLDLVSVDPQAASITFTVSGGPDINNDAHVDLRDYAKLQACYGQPATGACVLADVDADGDVDVGDFAILQDCLGGPALLPACGGGGA